MKSNTPLTATSLKRDKSNENKTIRIIHTNIQLVIRGIAIEQEVKSSAK